MDSNLSQREHIAVLVSAVLAHVALSRIGVLAGSRRVQRNELVPRVFRESIRSTPDSAAQLLAWARSYREVIRLLCAIRDQGRTVERLTLLNKTHAEFIEQSLAVLEKRLARP